MEITTPEFEKDFKEYPPQAQKEAKDPTVIAKLVNKAWNAVWFLTEYNPQTKVALAYAKGMRFRGRDKDGQPIKKFKADWERVNLSRFEKGDIIALDEAFLPKPLSECLLEIDEQGKSEKAENGKLAA